MTDTTQVPLEGLLIRYGVFMHRRFYDREKRRFLVALAQEFESYGYETQIKMKKHGAFKIRNLYVGNPQSAKTIFTTYYDTPSFSGSSTIKILDKTPNKSGVALASAIPLALIMIVGVAFIQYIGLPNWSENFWSGASMLSILFSLLLFGLLMYFRRGIGVRRNVVRNTSSVLAMIEAARSLDESKREKIAFAFTDYGCVNHFGEKLAELDANDKNQSKNYIMLDSVGAIGTPQVLTTGNLSNRVKAAAQAVYQSPILPINLDKAETRQLKLHQQTVVLASGILNDKKEIIASKKVSDENSKQMMTNIKQAAQFILAMSK